MTRLVWWKTCKQTLRFSINVLFLLLALTLVQGIAWSQEIPCVWSMQIPCADGNAGARYLATDPQGNILVAGTHKGTLNLNGNTLDCAGGLDIFLAKFTADGQHIWSRSFGDAEDQWPLHIGVDALGNIAMTGSFEGVVNFGGGNLVNGSPYGYGDIFIVKFDPDGNQQWSKCFGTDWQNRGSSVEFDSAGDVYLAGTTIGRIDFGGGFPPGLGSTDTAYIVKFTADGQYVWDHRYYYYSFADGLLIDDEDNLIITGTFADSTDFGGGTVHAVGSYDFFLLKLDSDGNFIWNRTYGGESNEDLTGANPVCLDTDNNIIMTGRFTGTLDFGGGAMTTQPYQYDVFICKFDSEGHFTWAKSFTGATWLMPPGVVSGPRDNLYIHGGFTGNLDFGGGDLGESTYDIFLASFDPAGNFLADRFIGPAGSIYMGTGVPITAADDGFLIGGMFRTQYDFGAGELDANGWADVYLAKYVFTPEDWPDNTGPSITLRIEESESVGRISLARLSKLSPAAPSEDVNDPNIDAVYAQVVDGFATFTTEDLFYLGNGEEITRLDLLQFVGPELISRGHIGFHYSFGDLAAAKHLDAYIFLHDDIAAMGSNPVYDAYREDGWEYYVDREHPVTMLVPPAGLASGIDGSPDRPVLFVHGVAAVHNKCWRDVPDFVDSEEYDAWRFYYPYDQIVPESAGLLGKAINNILIQGRLVGNPGYGPGTKLDIVAHSMGGLVSRLYLQSDDYDNWDNVRKLLMFSTPNHGSHIAYKMYHRFWGPAELADIFTLKDTRAPAYEFMSPGNHELFQLNTEEPRDLGTGFPFIDYLVVAGTAEIRTAGLHMVHSEIEGQDDGVTSVSSASMLEWDIPVAIVEENHLDIKLVENAPAIIEEFLSSSYDPGLDPFGDLVDCFVTSFSEPPCVTGIPMNEDAGVWAPRLLFASASAGRYAIDEIVPGTVVLWENDVAQEDQDDIYLQRNGDFSPHFFTVSDLEARSVELGPRVLEDIGLRLTEGIYNILVFRGEEQLGSIVGGLDFRHLRTTLATLSYDPVAQAAHGASNRLTPIPLKSTAAASVVTIDSAVDTVTFALSTTVPGTSFEGHGFTLVDPFGGLVDPTSASIDPAITFDENTAFGPVYYQVINPSSGTWELHHSGIVNPARLLAYVHSAFAARLQIDSPAQGIADSVTCAVNVTGGETCSDLHISLHAEVKLANSGEIIDLGSVPLASDGSGVLTGRILAGQEGQLRFDLHCECETAGGEVLVRDAIQTVWIDSGEHDAAAVRNPQNQIPTKGAGGIRILAPYPNPSNPTSTVSFELSTDAVISIRIYDVSGRLVRRLVDSRPLVAGHHDVLWKGRDDLGRSVSSGVYLVRVEAPYEHGEQKLTLVR